MELGAWALEEAKRFALIFVLRWNEPPWAVVKEVVPGTEGNDNPSANAMS